MAKINNNIACTESKNKKVLDYVLKRGKEGIISEVIESTVVDGKINTVIRKTYGKSTEDCAVVTFCVGNYVKDFSFAELLSALSNDPASIYLNKWDLSWASETEEENKQVLDVLCQIEENTTLEKYCGIKNITKKPLYELFFEEN